MDRSACKKGLHKVEQKSQIGYYIMPHNLGNIKGVRDKES